MGPVRAVPVPSPSERDGLTPQQVAAIKRTTINTIIDVGTRLNMDVHATAAAIVFFHRYFAIKSLVRSDPFLLGVACLYLGGKSENSPKSVKDVLLASCELRFADPRRLNADRALYQSLRDAVFLAERALLYSINFGFEADLPFKPFFELLKAGGPLGVHHAALVARDPARARQLAQIALNLINDSLRTEACLWHSGVEVAVGCVWLAMKLLKEDTHATNEHGQLWWVAAGVDEAALEGVAGFLQRLYDADLPGGGATAADLALQAAGVQGAAQLAAEQAAAQQQQQGGLPPDAVGSGGKAAAQAPAAAAAAVAAIEEEEEENYDDVLAAL